MKNMKIIITSGREDRVKDERKIWRYRAQAPGRRGSQPRENTFLLKPVTRSLNAEENTGGEEKQRQLSWHGMTCGEIIGGREEAGDEMKKAARRKEMAQGSYEKAMSSA